MSEKNRRIYYQDIVYKVCNLLDTHYGRKPGTGLVCGTIEEPSSEVQDELATLLTEHAALKRENEALKDKLMDINVECLDKTATRESILVVLLADTQEQDDGQTNVTV